MVRGEDGFATLQESLDMLIELYHNLLARKMKMFSTEKIALYSVLYCFGLVMVVLFPTP